MESLYLLIPVALIFCVLVIRLLLWAIDDGQYDDLEKESWRILIDDEPPPPAVPSGVKSKAQEPGEKDAHD